MASQEESKGTKSISAKVISTYVPKIRAAEAKLPIIAPALLVAIQAVFIVLLGLHADYERKQSHSTVENTLRIVRSVTTYPNGTVVHLESHEPVESAHRISDFYPTFQDIHVMIFIGFGFLMTFLKRYSFSAVGYNFLIAAFVVEWALIFRGYLFDFDTTTRSFPLNIEKIIVADCVAASVLISFGAVLGKANLSQLVIMAFIEVVLQSANEFVGLRWFCAYDVGESVFVHVFGSYFGLSVAFMIYDKKIKHTEVTEREKSNYHSDLFAMIGTLFLFCYWPSFNAGAATTDEARLRAIVNTYISIASSVLLTFALSSLLHNEKKFDMVHVQNATLAGGVAVGTVADKMIGPVGAMVIGSLAGAVSTVGFRFIKPIIEKIRVHDTCGVHNLHGLPGVFAGIFGIIVAAFPAYSLYQEGLSKTCLGGLNRSAMMQVGYQSAALGLTILVAVIGGCATGFLLGLPIFKDDVHSSCHNDLTHWEVPSDFHDSSTTELVPNSGEDNADA